MADIEFACPYCGQGLSAADDMVGEVVDCPACQQQITVPAAQELAPPSSEEAAAAPATGEEPLRPEVVERELKELLRHLAEESAAGHHMGGGSEPMVGTLQSLLNLPSSPVLRHAQIRTKNMRIRDLLYAESHGWISPALRDAIERFLTRLETSY